MIEISVMYTVTLTFKPARRKRSYTPLSLSEKSCLSEKFTVEKPGVSLSIVEIVNFLRSTRTSELQEC